jgi:diguanylate cyclase (GGDEF)-like protein
MNNDEKSLDCLTEILRNYGQHSFSIKHDFNFENPQEYFEKWSSHLLMGTSHPVTDEKGISLDKRDFSGEVQSFKDYRKVETSWVNKSTHEQRDVLWLIVKELGQLVQQGADSDKRIIKQFESLLKVAKNEDTDAIKKAVESSVSMVISELSQRETKAKDGLDEMTLKVEALEQQLTETKEKAEIDPLTKVFTRGTFDEKIKDAKDLFGRTNSPACLFFIDVDNFKAVNDNYGHQVGDEVLQKIADCSVSILQRKGDVVARFGGDEFAAIMPDATLEDGIKVGEKIVQAVASIKYQNPELQSTISVGVSEIGTSDTVETWLKKSDRAVYLAKGSGRNNLKFI